MKRLNTKIFIDRAQKKHGDIYDYSKVNYVNNRTKVTIICSKHGEFNQIPYDHMNGRGCSKCGLILSGKKQRLSKNDFVGRANKKHQYKYDYSKSVIANSMTKTLIICPEHGEFYQAPISHVTGQGCPECGLVSRSNKRRYSKKDFVRIAKKIHRDIYDYSNVNYVNSKTKVTIICPIHSSFELRPNSHFNGQGCPDCGVISMRKNLRYSTQEFIKSVIKIHGDKYDYSKVNYVNSKTKVTIICPIHGSFKIMPNTHYNGAGCSECGLITAIEKIVIPYDEFLERAEKIHNHRYIYDEASYTNYTQKMRILCSEHGWFKQKPHSHISQQSGCRKCGYIKNADNRRLDWATVKELFKNAHSNKYQYDQSTYVDVTTKMKIKCPKHGWFKQPPYSHYGGIGCLKCGYEEVAKKLKINREEFIERARKTHGDKYTYSEMDFKDIFTAIEIECSKHGFFSQIPVNHYTGSGCPKCNSSRGERKVRLWLNKSGVTFEEQKTFDDLIHINKLRCDFYLPDHNTVIEFNGMQHYESIDLFGGIKGLEQTQKRDIIKYNYLDSENIRLIIVRYDNPDVKSFLREKLFRYS